MNYSLHFDINFKPTYQKQNILFKQSMAFMKLYIHTYILSQVQTLVIFNAFHISKIIYVCMSLHML